MNILKTRSGIALNNRTVYPAFGTLGAAVRRCSAKPAINASTP
jgi:hypothetical protein